MPSREGIDSRGGGTEAPGTWNEGSASPIRLGAGGIAIVTLDGNPLGPAGKGLRIWVVAVSINHAANPVTVSQVSAPLLIVLD